MKKLCIALLLGSCLIFTGCGNSAGQEAPAAQTEEKTEAETTEAVEPTAEAAREALKRVGGFFALTAMASDTGLTATSCKSSTATKTTTVTGKRLIFFFSATGNSLYVGKTIAGEEGQMLSIPQEIHKENPVYEAEEIGFVFPLYCFIPPTIVQNFIRKSTFKANYIFAVGTYGADYTLFPEYFDKLAEECGFSVNYISAVKMVDTYLPY